MNKCIECGKEFKPTQHSSGKFCSHSCSAKTNNRKYPRKTNPNKIRNCLKCGKKLISSQSKFCSKTCSGEFKRDSRFKAWIAGEAAGDQAKGSLRVGLRRALLDNAGWKCSECGWDKPNPITGKPILAIDHIDGNWKNNNSSNLKVICYNCHTLTPTFGSLNKNGMSYERTGRVKK